MILLLGGTAETGPAASALARAGFFVLACTATDAPICIDEGPRIQRHIGRLDDTAMRTLARQIGGRDYLGMRAGDCRAAAGNPNRIADCRRDDGRGAVAIAPRCPILEMRMALSINIGKPTWHSTRSLVLRFSSACFQSCRKCGIALGKSQGKKEITAFSDSGEKECVILHRMVSMLSFLGRDSDDGYTDCLGQCGLHAMVS